MTQREILEQKLTLARVDLKTAGPIHRRDLKKHIHRMERELRDYNRFQSAACQDERVCK